MVVEFIIEPKMMKESLVPAVFIQELKAFKKEIGEGKAFVTDDNDKIIITITDDKLEKEFIDGFSKTREKLSMKVLEKMCKLKVLKDKKEVKLW